MREFWGIVSKQGFLLWKNNGDLMAWTQTDFWKPGITAQGWAEAEAAKLNVTHKEYFEGNPGIFGIGRTGKMVTHPCWPFRAVKLTITEAKE